MAKKTPSARASKFDPVEDAKMAVEGEELPEQPVDPAEAGATAPDEPATPEPAAEAPAPGKTPPKKPPVVVRLPLYEVEETCYAQIGGMRHRLKKGKTIDSESYGKDQLKSMREQGVKLKEIERS